MIDWEVVQAWADLHKDDSDLYEAKLLSVIHTADDAIETHQERTRRYLKAFYGKSIVAYENKNNEPVYEYELNAAQTEATHEMLNEIYFMLLELLNRNPK